MENIIKEKSHFFKGAAAVAASVALTVGLATSLATMTTSEIIENDVAYSDMGKITAETVQEDLMKITTTDGKWSFDTLTLDQIINTSGSNAVKLDGSNVSVTVSNDANSIYNAYVRVKTKVPMAKVQLTDEQVASDLYKYAIPSSEEGYYYVALITQNKPQTGSIEYGTSTEIGYGTSSNMQAYLKDKFDESLLEPASSDNTFYYPVYVYSYNPYASIVGVVKPSKSIVFTFSEATINNAVRDNLDLMKALSLGFDKVLNFDYEVQAIQTAGFSGQSHAWTVYSATHAE